MKRLLLAAALLLSGCAVTQAGIGVGHYAYETNQQVIVATTDKGTEQVHLALTGGNDTFLPSVDKDADGTALGTCAIKDKVKNIWNCDLGKIPKAETRTVSFEGKLQTGNLFAYEQITGRIIFDIVKTK